MATILDGKALREKIFEQVKLEVANFPTTPRLAVILAGENTASKIYVNNKKKAAEKLGIISEIINYPNTVTENELLKKIEELNNNSDVNAILVQLPLPENISKNRIIDAIAPQKDVDGFTPYNCGKLFVGETPIVYPCTPKGIILLLEENGIDITGKHAVIVGRSNIVGKPVAQMLLNKNATVTVCHSYTKNLTQITQSADILISAVGKPIINSNMVKKDAIVIDVGIFKDENGKTRGDVDFEGVSKVCSHISPVPGGVGPMTITSLMLNTIELYKQQIKL